MAITTELVVFNFDETIVNCDSGSFIKKLAPSGVIPPSIDTSFDRIGDCVSYMQQIFGYFKSTGVFQADYERCLATMPFVAGLKELLANLYAGCDGKRFELIIISDANDFFINFTLAYNNLDHSIKNVFTNSAQFDESGELKLQRFHNQDWCHLSARNLCKGQVLKEYIAQRANEGIQFDRINYVGDGANDLCPALELSARDRLFPRTGFTLHQLVTVKAHACDSWPKELQAQVFPFNSGDDIWQVLAGQ